MTHPLNRKAAKWLLVASALPFVLLAASAQAKDASQWGSGKNLYDKVCGQCHAPEVGVGTALAGRNLPEAYVKFVVRNGLNAMPAFPASFIDDESIAQVTRYLATLPAPASQP
ncbi:c-type cytochrome [Dokdonella sp.]|uniref:c-type cytochrome n=1 Tax=Dokdonella sp. TaxID=2291710 RepID=UPI0031C77D12|nr:cytochrome c [Dokdonella sp.]